MESTAPEMESIGTLMQDMWDNLEKENFSQVLVNLWSLKEKVTSIDIPTYAWEDALLKTSSTEFTISMQEIEQLVDVLIPLAEKTTKNPNAAMTEEDEAIVTKTETLLSSIDEHFTKATQAWDSYAAANN